MQQANNQESGRVDTHGMYQIIQGSRLGNYLSNVSNGWEDS